jgi:hypothetical protein
MRDYTARGNNYAAVSPIHSVVREFFTVIDTDTYIGLIGSVHVLFPA